MAEQQPGYCGLCKLYETCQVQGHRRRSDGTSNPLDLLWCTWQSHRSLVILGEAEGSRQGSYAGARAAHMKILYPELVFGAIASSGRCMLHNMAGTHLSITQL